MSERKKTVTVTVDVDVDLAMDELDDEDIRKEYVERFGDQLGPIKDALHVNNEAKALQLMRELIRTTYGVAL